MAPHPPVGWLPLLKPPAGGFGGGSPPTGVSGGRNPPQEKAGGSGGLQHPRATLKRPFEAVLVCALVAYAKIYEICHGSSLSAESPTKVRFVTVRCPGCH